jgi:hypothetical protein
MDLLLRGEILMQDIDDFIDAWHDAADGSAASLASLPEYLGMTEDEYQLWVEHPSSLRFIAAAHKTKQPVGVLLASPDRLGLAARASDRTEAERLVQWLVKRGRIEEPKQPW